MLTIQIKNKNQWVIANINTIYSLQVDDEVNKGWKLKLKFAVEDWLQKRPIQKWDRISVVYWLKIWDVIRIFEWYITDVVLKSTIVEIEAENRLSYLQYRIVRNKKTYNNVAIKTIVSQVFNELNTTSNMPLTLGLNDCDTTITKDFDTWTSLYDILKACWEAEPKLIVRVVSDDKWNTLEVSKSCGKMLDWVREFDVNYTRWNNIIDWNWKDSMDDFYSYVQNKDWSDTNTEFVNRTNLLFEKYEENWSLSLPNGVALPSVQVSRDTDWWGFYIGDRKNIRLVTWYEWLPLEYLWMIQSRKITISPQNDIKAEIKITEEYKADTNILDLVLQNLRKK